MYINRKDGTLVEAEKYYSIGLKRDGWIVKTDNNTLYIPAKDFQGQYGEAMICPLRKDCPIECIRKQPHPKSSLCSVPGCYGTSCVSYIPEEHKEYDIDNEPVFPICGTCNARKSNLSKLMLTSEQLNEVVWRYTDKENQTYALGTIIKEIAKAQISHLAKPEFNLYRYQGADIYIPLSDYLKEGE